MFGRITNLVNSTPTIGPNTGTKMVLTIRDGAQTPYIDGRLTHSESTIPAD